MRIFGPISLWKLSGGVAILVGILSISTGADAAPADSCKLATGQVQQAAFVCSFKNETQANADDLHVQFSTANALIAGKTDLIAFVSGPGGIPTEKIYLPRRRTGQTRGENR